MYERSPIGGVFRIRPGHLANFSGGAGYMPFIVIFSYPTSLVCGIIGLLILELRARALLRESNKVSGNPDEAQPQVETRPTPLHEYVRYAVRHLLVSVVVSVIAGIVLTVMATGMVYGNKVTYFPAAVAFAAGPFLAWLLSTALLARLDYREGPGPGHLATALTTLVVMLVVCFFGGMGVLTLVDSIRTP